MTENVSYIFLTTPTSATASMWRIFTTIAEGKIDLVRYTDKFYLENNLKAISDAIIPQDGSMYLFNVPHLLNTSHEWTKYKLLINVRDPRDLLCNMFHWRQVHPEPGMDSKELFSQRQALKEKGIDDFALETDISSFFHPIMEVAGKVEKSNLLFTTYSNLCMHFDELIKGIGDFLEIAIDSKTLLNLENERVENLENNKEWIGNHWAGSDIMPGRYKNELNPATISKLNLRYENVIKFCEDADSSLLKRDKSLKK